VNVRILVGGSIGAVLGAVVAYVGAVYVFVCRPVSFITSDGGTYFADCGSPQAAGVLRWGVAIGLTIGLATALWGPRYGALMSRKRWLVTFGSVVILAVAMILWLLFFNEPPQKAD
jgi:hypothetical protein